MSQHSSCPNCHNTHHGDKVYQCYDKNHIYCYACAVLKGLNSLTCPICGSVGKKIGEIEENEKSR